MSKPRIYVQHELLRGTSLHVSAHLALIQDLEMITTPRRLLGEKDERA